MFPPSLAPFSPKPLPGDPAAFLPWEDDFFGGHSFAWRVAALAFSQPPSRVTENRRQLLLAVFHFFWQFAEYGDVFRNICLFGGGLPARWEMVLARKKGAGWNPKTSQKWHFLTIFDPCPFSKFPGWSHVHFSGPRGRGVPESGWELLAGNNWLDSWTPRGKGGEAVPPT